MNEGADLQAAVPPNSYPAEQAVLGGVLLENARFADIQGLVAFDDFYAREHQILFRAISAMMAKDCPVDILTLCEFLKEKGFAEDVGGLAYLGWLAKNTPSAANIATYADIVRERSLSRKILALAGNIKEWALGGGSARDVLAKAETAIFALGQAELRGKKGFVRVKDSLKAVIDRIEQNYDSPPNDGVLGVSTGFGQLDKLTMGLGAGNLVVVAARPAMGKSTLAMDLAKAAAFANRPTVFFSLEMENEELTERLLAGVSGVGLATLKESWKIEDSHWPLITAACTRLGGMPLWIDDSPGLSALDIRGRCMRLNTEIAREYPTGIGMIVIDYVQLMGSDVGRDNNRNNQIEDCTRTLKRMAKEFGVPVVLLSQLNRKCEERPNKRPILSDLRDSGAVEQDADIVVFVYRDEVYHDDTLDAGIAEIIIAKHRNGPLGTVRLAFDGPCTRFRDLANGRYDNGY